MLFVYLYVIKKQKSEKNTVNAGNNLHNESGNQRSDVGSKFIL